MIQINVVRAFSFDYKYLSEYKIKGKVAIDKDIARVFDTHTQWPVGYEIQNVGTEPIKDIICSKYKKVGDYYVGTEYKKDLLPNEYIILPTRYIIMLLFQNSKNLEVENGTFVPILKDLSNKDDTNILLSNYCFMPCRELLDFLFDAQYCDGFYNDYYTDMDYDDLKWKKGVSPLFYRKIGYVELEKFMYEVRHSNFKITSFDKFDVHIIESKFLQLFGNCENKYQKVKSDINISSINRSILFLKNCIKG